MAPEGCLIGAGTVLTVEDVNRLADARRPADGEPECRARRHLDRGRQGHGDDAGRLHPHRSAGRQERAGATGLKFFPASVLAPAGIQAIRAVLPAELEIAAVGGVSEKNFGDYAAIGIRSFGLGSSLYKVHAADGANRAKATIEAYDAVYGAGR